MSLQFVPAEAWRIGGGGKSLGRAVLAVVGILNITPDSFYDGGRDATAEAAVVRGMELVLKGADMVDVGGESTRPGAESVGPQEELARVLPVITGLRAADPDLPVSVDTTKAEVAKACLEAGANVVNDVSACRFDPVLVDVLVQFQPGYVLMHSLGRPKTMQVDPRYGDVVDEVRSFFEERMAFLVRAGLPEDRIALDPGIGFGKRLEHNLSLLRSIERLAELGRPLYVGVSNKSLWGDLLGLGINDRERVTEVATALLGARGVAVHRVHDPAGARTALAMAQALSPSMPVPVRPQ
ncbi:MAG: dihydropteroate synthase [Deltaproteobacteria bacterium]|nr:dihydropteroate synthase [Deltaproteobacteria bacterium]